MRASICQSRDRSSLAQVCRRSAASGARDVLLAEVSRLDELDSPNPPERWKRRSG